MTTKSNRYMDPQGRIIIPTHIRKALNLAPGNLVEVALEDDGTIRIRPSIERCCICGDTVEGMRRAELAKGKFVCYSCCQKVAKAMMK